MKKIILSLFVLCLALVSCKKEDQINPSSGPSQSGARAVKGYAQKGPFVVGSSITVFELDGNFSQTGRSFFSQINDNTGSFDLGNINLASKNVIVRADGFYYNEICGENSVSQISLNCISDLSNASSLNVNLMTHLEKPRVEYLLSQGVSFSAAKAQAQAEVMNIFSISLSGMPPSENLNMSQPGDTNAVLLAISSILQGFRTESELSALLATISGDIRIDGILNDTNIQSSLISHALTLDTTVIRNNLINFYSSLNTTASVPFFGKYVNQFILNSHFARTNLIMLYPASGTYGANLLFPGQTVYTGSDFSFTGTLRKCSGLKVRIKVLSGAVYWITNPTNLTVTPFDFTNNEQFFTVFDSNAPFEVDIGAGSGTCIYRIDYYENNRINATFSKTITVN